MEVVSTSDANVDVSEANSEGDGLFVACATAVLNGKALDADSDGSSTGYGRAGVISILCSGDISGTATAIHAIGTGGDSGGDITIVSSGGSVNLGTAFDASSSGASTSGGIVSVLADGDITLGTSSRSLQSQGSGTEADGGAFVLESGGAVTINGTINTNGNGSFANGGFIDIVGESLATGTSWNARGDSDGSGGIIDVSLMSGAGTLTTTTGNASWDVTANGEGFGGLISIHSIGDITLAGDMDAGGTGLNSFSGDIDLVTTGDISVASTSRLEADAAGIDSSNGGIFLSACNITVSGVIDTRDSDVFGNNTFVYAGTFTQNSSSSMSADDFLGNTIFCRCVDTSPANNVCDSSTCVSAPTLSGSATPTVLTIPASLPACS